MWSFKNHDQTIVQLLLAVAIGLDRARTTWSCSCVPERLCPVPDVDLRLTIAEDECPLGMVCCDVAVSDTPKQVVEGLPTFCEGTCVADQGKCFNDAYDEYGSDLIDIRLTGDNGCPVGQYCCRDSVEASPTCDGSCLPRSLCTMFEAPRVEGCAEGKVCCHMNHATWMGLVNDINEMVVPVPRGSQQCDWSPQSTDSRNPPWLVSVWSRLEIIPGLQLDQFMCSGVLMDPALVLTIASCVEPLPVEELFVNIGDHDISSRSSLRAENIYTIEQKVVHEDYNISAPMHHNVALLRISGTVRNGGCQPQLSSEKSLNNCYTIGWDRQLLATGKSSIPVQHDARVKGFDEDLFCAPGTICLDSAGGNCEGESLPGSPVVCQGTNSQQPWPLRGLLVGNCTGIATDGIAAWVNHQRAPEFVQKPKATDPSRQYLPVL
ncbi:uncharacterized protein LOC128721129 [Anopheles nili]|uniref:uncharacterized protein LOC128721129 n=1 Tax=Anopheles nili TaxID=185578 RepID=UPI00237C438B|nr:uncharacterized protein LOC128721129 [Anopheles nili]